jgi:hypothetical protein
MLLIIKSKKDRTSGWCFRGGTAVFLPFETLGRSAPANGRADQTLRRCSSRAVGAWHEESSRYSFVGDRWLEKRKEPSASGAALGRSGRALTGFGRRTGKRTEETCQSDSVKMPMVMA